MIITQHIPFLKFLQADECTSDAMLVYGLWVNLHTTHFQINEEVAAAN